MKAMTERIKEWARIAGIIIAAMAVAAVFLIVAMEFMWACHDAGLPT